MKALSNPSKLSNNSTPILLLDRADLRKRVRGKVGEEKKILQDWVSVLNQWESMIKNTLKTHPMEIGQTNQSF